MGAVADMGGGTGRIVELYSPRATSTTIVDPSKEQLVHAEKAATDKNKATYLIGTVEKLPFPDRTFDTAVCVRVFHYVKDPWKAIRETYRVLKPGGYLILEIPNKRHFKNRVKNSFGVVRHRPIDTTIVSDDMFVNHDPDEIALILTTVGFNIVEKRSVSNFRSAFLKKILLLSLLLAMERMLQRPLSTVCFGPSIYFLARKHG